MYIDSSKHITPEPTPTHTTGLIWITTQTNVIKYWLHQLLQIPCMYSILYLIWNMLQFFFSSKKILGDLFAEKETKRRPILAKGLLRRPRSPKGDLFGNTANRRSWVIRSRETFCTFRDFQSFPVISRHFPSFPVNFPSISRHLPSSPVNFPSSPVKFPSSPVNSRHLPSIPENFLSFFKSFGPSLKN